MKKLLIITGFIFALALYSNTVSAQDFRDGYGHNIGKIESDGTVRDGNGHNIGSAKGVDKKHAAVFFFFNKFDQ